MLELMKRKQQRFKYLETLYKMVGGSPLDTVTHNKIGVQAELTKQGAEDAFYYLLNEKLLEAQYLAGVVSAPL